jgi:reactive intermediate/imine deaminase
MEEVFTDEAPDYDLPFSQATVHGDTVYTSGQVPVDPDTLEVVGSTIEEQTERTMENLAIVLEAAGSSLDHALKTTVFLTDIEDFDAFNETYRQYVSRPYPARSAYEVSDLAIDILVEIEMVAELPV